MKGSVGYSVAFMLMMTLQLLLALYLGQGINDPGERQDNFRAIFSNSTIFCYYVFWDIGNCITACCADAGLLLSVKLASSAQEQSEVKLSVRKISLWLWNQSGGKCNRISLSFCNSKEPSASFVPLDVRKKFALNPFSFQVVFPLSLFSQPLESRSYTFSGFYLHYTQSCITIVKVAFLHTVLVGVVEGEEKGCSCNPFWETLENTSVESACQLSKQMPTFFPIFLSAAPIVRGLCSFELNCCSQCAEDQC